MATSISFYRGPQGEFLGGCAHRVRIVSNTPQCYSVFFDAFGEFTDAECITGKGRVIPIRSTNGIIWTKLRDLVRRRYYPLAKQFCEAERKC